MNGAKASNKGKVVSDPAHFVVMVDDSILEQKSSRGRGEPSGGVEFKVISRAKLFTRTCCTATRRGLRSR